MVLVFVYDLALNQACELGSCSGLTECRCCAARHPEVAAADPSQEACDTRGQKHGE